jgi:hypothetical protein
MEMGIEQQRKKVVGRRHEMPCSKDLERIPADPAGKGYSGSAVAAAEPNMLVSLLRYNRG